MKDDAALKRRHTISPEKGSFQIIVDSESTKEAKAN